MSDEHRGGIPVEIDGEEYTYSLDLADLKEIENEWGTGSLEEFGQRLQSASFGDIIYLLEMGLDTDLKEGAIAKKVTPKQAIETVVGSMQSMLNIDIENENLPPEMKEKVKKKGSKGGQNPAN